MSLTPLQYKFRPAHSKNGPIGIASFPSSQSFSNPAMMSIGNQKKNETILENEINKMKLDLLKQRQTDRVEVISILRKEENKLEIKKANQKCASVSNQTIRMKWNVMQTIFLKIFSY